MSRITLILATVVCVSLAFSLSAAGQSPRPDNPVQMAIAETARARVAYSFDLEHVSGGETLRARFAPNTQPRLRLVAPASRDQLSEALRGDFDYLSANVDGLPWCANALLSNIRDLRLVREDDTVAIYSFQPTPQSVTGDQTRQVANHLRGELTFVKASHDISRVRLFAPRPFQPAPIARVDVYTVTTSCALAPNGRYYVSEQARQVRASALGRPHNVDVVRRHRLVAPAQ